MVRAAPSRAPPGGPFGIYWSYEMRPLQLAVCSCVAACLLWLSGCKTTTLSTTWKDPSAGTLSFNKVVAVVLNSSPAERRAQEDTLATTIKRVSVVPSYSIIPDEMLNDFAKAKQRIIDGGFDGALILRLVDAREETTYVPPSVSGWDSGWAWGHDSYQSYHVNPGYTVTDTMIRAEISLYRVPDGKLLWAASSETTNPANAREFARDIVKAAADELRKQGMLN